MQKMWLLLYKLSARRLKKHPTRRPTIYELEAILSSTDTKEIIVLPNGEILAV
jgi:hypothetical protein